MKVLIAAMALFCFAPLLCGQTINVDASDANTGTLQNSLLFGHFDVFHIPDPARPGPPPAENFPTGEGIASKRIGEGNIYGLDFYTFGVPRITVTHGGLVGIGMPPSTLPKKLLELHGPGDVELGLQSTDPSGRFWTLQSSAIANSGPLAALSGTFQIIDRTQNLSRLRIDSAGLVTVNALQILGGADIAEPFRISDSAMPAGAVVEFPGAVVVPAGAVVVIDEKHPGRLRLSTEPYDRRVAGVISGAAGVHPALTLTQFANGEGVDGNMQDVALTGRVYVLADATSAPIQPGDLLTTSATPGHCMKASDYDLARGAILGKAMSSLAAGKGLVLALVTLQ